MRIEYGERVVLFQDADGAAGRSASLRIANCSSSFNISAITQPRSGRGPRIVARAAFRTGRHDPAPSECCEPLLERRAAPSAIQDVDVSRRVDRLSSESTMNPVTPWSITSGTEPPRNATTGTPHASASIMTRPNGSGQSIGNSKAVASPRNAAFSCSSISPMNSTSGLSSSGRISSSK